MKYNGDMCINERRVAFMNIRNLRKWLTVPISSYALFSFESNRLLCDDQLYIIYIKIPK